MPRIGTQIMGSFALFKEMGLRLLRCFATDTLMSHFTQTLSLLQRARGSWTGLMEAGLVCNTWLYSCFVLT